MTTVRQALADTLRSLKETEGDIVQINHSAHKTLGAPKDYTWEEVLDMELDHICLHGITIWTTSSVIVLNGYECYRSLEVVPRNPVPDEVLYIGS